MSRSNPAEVSPTRASSWFALAVFFVAAVLSYTDRQILNLIVDPLRQSLQIDDFQVSLLQGAAFAVTYALFGLVLGRWADTHNRRNLIAAGVLIWSGATVACGFATSFEQVFVARMLVGVGEATLAPAAISLIHDLFPDRRRGTAMAIFMTGMVAGVGAASLTGGALLEVFAQPAMDAALPAGFEPWRAVLIAMGIPGIVVFLLLLGVREPRRGRTRQIVAPEKRSLAHAFLELGSERRTLGFLIAGIALATTVEYATGAWLPTLLMRVHGLSPSAVGAYLGTAIIVAGGAGTLLGGVISDALLRSGRKNARLLVPTFALMLALPTLALPLAADPHTVIALFAVYTALTAMATTSGIAAVQEVVGDTLRGFAMSLIAFANTAVGLGLGPSLVGFSTSFLLGGDAAVARSIVSVGVPLLCGALLMLWLAIASRRRCDAELAAGARS